MFNRLKAMKQASSRDGSRHPKRVQHYPERPACPGRIEDWDYHREYGWIRKRSGNWKPTHINVTDSRRPAIINAARDVSEWEQRRQNKHKTAMMAGGNLIGDDYRFWVGCQQTASTFARCRACHEPTFSHQMRAAHMEERKCTMLLIKAYEALRLDRVCVVCDSKTFDDKWGVPLCNKAECLRIWMFEYNKRLPDLDRAIFHVLPRVAAAISKYWQDRAVQL